MRRLLLLLTITASLIGQRPASAHTWQGTFTKYTLPATADYPSRDYYVYVPPAVATPRTLVVFLHGCTQTAMQAALGVRWNELADERGFVVAYPEQSIGLDGDAARCWNYGQALIYPREQGEIASIAAITDAVTPANDIDAGHVFVAGISSGAIMASTMTASYPDVYAAVMSHAGCGYPCADPTGVAAYLREGPYARVVPAIVFQGTTDDVVVAPLGELATEQWVGTNDLADDGLQNGSVSHAPSVENHFEPLNPSPGGGDPCIRNWNNPCPGGVLGLQEYPYTIRRYADSSGSVVVESWLIHGLMHNYPHGSSEGTFTDPLGPDINVPTYEFFMSHAR
jgi:poly(3-hydroxybutyrate) depolymerase